MKLAEYLKNTNQTVTAFAAKLGVTQSAVTKWALGKTFPRKNALDRIAALTAGQVTANDFYTTDQSATPKDGGAA